MSKARVKKFLPILPVAAFLGFAIWLAATPRLLLSSYRISQEVHSFETTAREIEATEAANRLLAAELRPMTELRATAMTLPREAAAALFRERIDQAAAASGLRIRTLSALRSSEPAEHVLLFEISITADGETAQAAAFLDELHRGVPRFYWRNITVKPAAAAGTEAVSVAGTLGALSFVAEPSQAGGGS